MNYFNLTAMQFQENGRYETLFENLFETSESFEVVFKHLTTHENGMAIEGRIVSYVSVRSFADFEVKVNIGSASSLLESLQPASRTLESLDSEFLLIPECDHFVIVSSPLSPEQIGELERFLSNSVAEEYAIVEDKYSFEHGASHLEVAYLISLAANFTVELVRWIVQEFFNGDNSQVKAFSLPIQSREYISTHARVSKRRLILTRQEILKDHITAFTFLTATDLYRIEMDQQGQVISYNSRKRRNA